MSTSAEVNLLHLAEMFPDLSFSYLSGLPANLPFRQLVDRCIQQSEIDRKIQKQKDHLIITKTETSEDKSNMENKSTLQTQTQNVKSENAHEAEEIQEFVSLLPPSIDLTNDDDDDEINENKVDGQILSSSSSSSSSFSSSSSAASSSSSTSSSSLPSSFPSQEIFPNVESLESSPFIALSSAIPSLSSGLECSDIVAFLRTLSRIVENLLQYPQLEKFRSLSLDNSALRQKVSHFIHYFISILLYLDFDAIGGGGKSDLYALSNENYSKEKLLSAQNQLQQLIISAEKRKFDLSKIQNIENLASQMNIEENPLYQTKATWKRKELDKSEKVVHEEPKPVKSKKITREEMAAKVQQRLHGGVTQDAIEHKYEDQSTADSSSSSSSSSLASSAPSSASSLSGSVRGGRLSDFVSVARVQKDIATLRAGQHSQWRTTRQGMQRVFTVDDLRARASNETNIRGQFGSSGRHYDHGSSEYSALQIGKEALKYTNEFRAKNGLPALTWNQSLHDIGMSHSVAMGDGKVPFDHVGFHDRVKKYPMAHTAAAENLAMNRGAAEVARVAVNGWIDSPGHRKNLLGPFDLCGIAVYRNAQGAYYLTQLFARTQ